MLNAAEGSRVFCTTAMSLQFMTLVHRIHGDIGTMQYNGYCTNTNDYYPSQNSKMFSKAWNYIHLIYIYIIIGFLLC